VPKNDHREPPDPSSIRRGSTVTINALSRIFAVLIILILCGAGGAFLDRWLGTSFWIVIGFGLGMVFAVVGMLYVVKVAEFENRVDASSVATSDPGSEGDG
jgi:F0F1-type ATP synthase assembly protein I